MLKRMRGRLDALYEEPEQRCRAGVTATSLLALALGGLVALAAALLGSGVRPAATPAVAALGAALLIATAALRWLLRGRERLARRVQVMGLWLAVSAAALFSPGSLGGALGAALLVALALSVVTLSRRAGLALTGLYAVSVIGVGLVHGSGRLPALSAPRVTAVEQSAALLLAVLVSGAALSAAVGRAARALQRAEARRRDLAQLLEIGSRLAAMPRLDEMLSAAAGDLASGFGFAQVQVLLLDADTEHAELRASSGDDSFQQRAELTQRAGLQRMRLSPDTLAGQAIVERAPQRAGGGRLSGAVKLPALQSELALPLLYGERVIGVLVIRSAEVEAFPAAQVEALQQFAAQLASLIYHAQALASEAALLEATSPILRAAQQIAVASRPEQILAVLRQSVARSADVLILLRPGEEALLPAAAWDREGCAPAARYPLQLLDALDEAGGLLAGEAAAFESFAGMQSVALLALRARGQTVGCLLVARCDGPALAEDELQALQSLTAQIGGALDSMGRIGSLEAAVEEARALASAVQALGAAADAASVQEIVLREAVRVTGAGRALLFLAGPAPPEDAAYVERVAVWQAGRVILGGDAVRYPAAAEPLAWQVPLSREVRVFEDLQRDEWLPQPLRAEYRRRGVGALAALPLWAGDAWLGSLVLEAPADAPFSARQVERAQAIIEVAARSLADQMSLGRLRQVAEREQRVNEVSTSLQEALGVEEVLHTALDGLLAAVGAERASVRLGQAPAPPPDDEGGAGHAASNGGPRTNGRSGGPPPAGPAATDGGLSNGQ